MNASFVITPSPLGSHFLITSKISLSLISSLSSSASSFRSSTEIYPFPSSSIWLKTFFTNHLLSQSHPLDQSCMAFLSSSLQTPWKKSILIHLRQTMQLLDTQTSCLLHSLRIVSEPESVLGYLSDVHRSYHPIFINVNEVKDLLVNFNIMLCALCHEILFGVEFLNSNQRSNVNRSTSWVDALIILAGSSSSWLFSVFKASSASGDDFRPSHLHNYYKIC